MKRTKSGIPWLLCLAVLAAVMSQAIFARPKMKCAWNEGPIVVDGQNKEWIGSLQVVDKKIPALGILRDEECLYLGVLFTDPARQIEILTKGMTVWFDPEGGTDKILGIRFPSGIGDIALFQGPPPNPDKGRRQDSGQDPGQDPGDDQGDRAQREAEQIDQIAGEALEKPEYFLILGPEKDQQTQIGFSGSENIEVRASRQDYTLFYELKIPLHRTDAHPFGIGVISGKKLGIGIETLADDAMQQQEKGGLSGGIGGGGSMGGGSMGGGSMGGGSMGGGSMGGGSMGGGSMGGGSMGGGGMPGGRERPDVLSPLKIWVQVEGLDENRQ